jgi:hypothetical protein
VIACPCSLISVPAITQRSRRRAYHAQGVLHEEVLQVCGMLRYSMLSQPHLTMQPTTVQLVEYAPEKRMTAAQALAHPLISASRVGKTLLRAKTLGSAATEAAASFTEPWLSSAASGAKLDVDGAA